MNSDRISDICKKLTLLQITHILTTPDIHFIKIHKIFYQNIHKYYNF